MQLPSGKSIPPASQGGRLVALLVATALVLGGVLAVVGARPRPPSLQVPTVVERMRDVAQLETLDVNVYKKLGYAPEPVATGNVWTDVFVWAKSALAPSRGRAIVFGTVRVGLDLSHLDASALAIRGNTVEVVLPPLLTRAEVRPGETEVIQSNLDSAQTAQLLELARVAFEQDARADAGLQAKARASAERALRGLLFSLGFRDVHFVRALPGGTGAG
jgi:hypothetical protein